MTHAQLVVVIGLDFSEFLNDGRMVNRKTSQSRHGFGGTLHITSLNPVARSLWEEDHSREENDGPSELDCDRNTIGSRVLAVVGSVIDNRSKEQTNGNGELVSSDDSTANPLWSSLRLVERDERRNKTNTKTSKETACNKERDGSRRSLENNTKGEDKDGKHQAVFATSEVTHRGSAEGAKEGTGREDGDNLRLLRRANVRQAVVGVDEASGELVSPIRHLQDATDGSSVISEEDTAKGDEKTDENGGHCRPSHTLGLLEHDPHDGRSEMRGVQVTAI